MKKALKIIFGIIGIIYVATVIFLTTCLLNYNKYNITTFKNSSLIIIEDEKLGNGLKKGDLVVVKHNVKSEIKKGEHIFFYNTYANKVDVSFSIVNQVETVEKETTFTIEGNYPLSQEYVIGTLEGAKVYNGVGGILKALESRWGFLLFVILPVLFIFIYEIYEVVKEVKTEKVEKVKTSKKNKEVEEL